MSFRPTSRRPAAVAGVLLAWSLPGLAHDFWIEPAAFRPAPGTRLPVTLRVGEDFAGTSQPFIPDWFVDFSVATPAGRTPVRGITGDDPAAILDLPSPGLALIGYYSNRSYVELDAERFDAYLRAEGLEHVSDRRRARGRDREAGREYYSRCAKSLVSVGAGPGAGFDRVLGYPLELIPRANPYALAPGDTLPVVLHFRGAPIGGVLVVAFTADAPARRFAARTGADGGVTLPLDRAGRWLVKAVHMIEVPASDPAADWESFWASLTFAVEP